MSLLACINKKSQETTTETVRQNRLFMFPFQLAIESSADRRRPSEFSGKTPSEYPQHTINQDPKHNHKNTAEQHSCQ